jgi:hypothetical protein
MLSLGKCAAVTLLAAGAALLAACGDNSGGHHDSGGADYLAIGRAKVELPPEIGSPFLLTTVSFDLASVGYRQQEYFLSGTATAFTNVSELTPDGHWQVEPGETDVTGLGAIASRQPDNDRFRLWEVAGTSHSDYYGNVSGREDMGIDPRFAVVVEENSVAGIINCERPMNAGPMPWVINAAISALHHWLLNGAVPARANRLAAGNDNTLFQLDHAGNAKGGVRTPYVDSPAAVLSGEINEGESFCRLFGTTDVFDAANMASLYVDKAGYMQAVSEATDKAVAKGFLLTADGERIKAAAGLQWDQLGG